MPRDFKSFAKENEKVINDNKDKANEYQDILNKYKNMDNNELMSNLFSEATKLKKEGKLDSQTLCSLQSTLSPFLNTEQQEMLKNLVNAINEQK
ncbi:MAG: hypothetical protein E7351_03445 [Clostridiales bacterium]|nr:hypothetical protein [Clostridiales bacterium]